jgi:hypothetical protein
LFVYPVVLMQGRRSSIFAVPVVDPIRDRLRSETSGDSGRASSFCIVPVIGRR